MDDVFISFFRVYAGAAFHHSAQRAAGQPPGGMFPGQHDIHQNPKGIDVGVEISLGQAVLLRGSKADCPQDLGVRFGSGFLDTGGIKVDEHRFLPPQDYIFRLDIPVDSAHGLEHPQRLTQLENDLPGLRRCK